MVDNKPYVRRLALKHWTLSSSSGIAILTVYGWQVWWGVLFSWQWWLAQSMRLPQKVGMATMSNGLFPVWLYRGHLWVTCRVATAADIRSKGAKTKPRYSAKEQWWWEFSDPSIHGLMENMDRAMLGLKQQHDLTWRSLEPTKKRTTKKKATGIGVRDNRYIPQWVKIHVVLRDKGRCVYCGESNIKILEFDHRKAWSKGGSSKDPLNICLGCKPCNRKKSDRDWGWM